MEEEVFKDWQSPPKFFARQETKLGLSLTASKRARSEVSEDQGGED